MALQLPPLSLDIEQFIRDVEERPAIWNRSYSCSKSFMDATWLDLSDKHSFSPSILKAKWKGLRDNFRVEFKRIPRDENGELLIEIDQYRSKWIHYNSLLFLADHMRSRQPKYVSLDEYLLEMNRRNSLHEEKQFPSNVIQIPDELQPLNLNKKHSGMLADIQIPSGAAAIVAQPLLRSDDSYCPPNKLRKDDTKNDEPDQSTTSSMHQQNAIASSMLECNMDKIDDDHHFLLSLHPYMSELKLSQKLRVRMKIQKLIFKELYKDDDENEDEEH